MQRSSYSLDELKKAVESSICYTDVCRQLNVTVCTFNFKRIQKLSQQYGLSLAHFDIKKAFRRNKPCWTDQEVFCEKSKFPRMQLRARAIRCGLYKYQCDLCKINATWNGQPLTIELDHVNGINDDNRLENLRWLCPNCHSQTPTYRRNSRKNKKPVV